MNEEERKVCVNKGNFDAKNTHLTKHTETKLLLAAPPKCCNDPSHSFL